MTSWVYRPNIYLLHPLHTNLFSSYTTGNCKIYITREIIDFDKGTCSWIWCKVLFAGACSNFGRITKSLRSRQDSNLCGQSPMDFESIALTTRPRLQCHLPFWQKLWKFRKSSLSQSRYSTLWHFGLGAHIIFSWMHGVIMFLIPWS